MAALCAVVTAASPALAVGTGGDVGRPYATDRIAPYLEITSSWAADHWKVYVCDTGERPRVDLDRVADAYNARVTPIFAEASGGLYAPRFSAAGVVKGRDVAACLSQAKGEGVVVLYVDPDVRGVRAHGVPPTVTVRDGKLSVTGRPSVIVGSRSGTSDGAGVLAHEIGHTLGWPHVPLSGPAHPAAGVGDYANLTNLMSSGESVAAWNRYTAGWSPATVHVATRTYRLDAPGHGDGGFVVVPAGEPGRLYTVAAGPDGVEIHSVDQTSSGRSACRAQKKQGFPVCFGTGTEVRAIAPPPDQSDSSQELPPWTPRTIGWTAGQAKTVGPVTVRVIEVVGEPGSYRAATVEIRGEAPGLWPSVETSSGSSGPTSEHRDPATGESEADEEQTPGSFADVPADSVFSDDIDFLVSQGITRGCNPPRNDRFCPDDPVTRGQMAAFLTRALGLPGGQARFSDTPGHVFASDVAALADAGITRGCNPPRNDRFCPDDPVTRGQMAAFLARALDLPGAAARFFDTAGHTFAADIGALADAGITKGCDPPANDRFCPDAPVTRGQMAAFLRRALQDRTPGR